MKNENSKGRIRQETDLKKLKLCKQRHLDNGYNFITTEIARHYHHECQKNPDSRRTLRVELQEKFGLTELEATNILYNRNVADYIRRYERIKQIEPLKINDSFDLLLEQILKNDL